MAFNQCVCLQYFRFPTVEHVTLQTYQRRLSVRPSASVANVHSAFMHAKLLFPGKRSRFNGRRTDAKLHAFVAIIGDILSSHDKNQIHVHNHARVHIELNVSVIIEPFHRESKHVIP